MNSVAMVRLKGAVDDRHGPRTIHDMRQSASLWCWRGMPRCFKYGFVGSLLVLCLTSIFIRQGYRLTVIGRNIIDDGDVGEFDNSRSELTGFGDIVNGYDGKLFSVHNRSYPPVERILPGVTRNNSHLFMSNVGADLERSLATKGVGF